MALTHYILKTFSNMTPSVKLMPIALALSLLVVMPCSLAAELSPSNNIKPSQSESIPGQLPEDSTINAEKMKAQKTNFKKARPGFWQWLTCSSNKPANFHYIDIIELLN